MNWNDDELDVALRGLREEQAPDAIVSSLRARVMADVRRRRVHFQQWGWRWALAPAVAAVMIAVMLWTPKETAQPSPVEVARTPESIAKPAPDETKPILKAGARQTGVRGQGSGINADRRKKPPSPERMVRMAPDETKPILLEATNTPGLVKIASSDPNILILWSLDDSTPSANGSESSNITANEGDSDQ